MMERRLIWWASEGDVDKRWRSLVQASGKTEVRAVAGGRRRGRRETWAKRRACARGRKREERQAQAASESESRCKKTRSQSSGGRERA
ncbi:hypothetical protein AGABI2DRAFT_194324, partial [Agaricus bisporus var. bisporus H97]|uniref:hypothetical protein n=1 Tax=Agaricus bisporus var. bisporus (strain H97 / ATCC MYA-4626 / FGSC 10389) TaxID=936046 RepID=UPI00029F5A42